MCSPYDLTSTYYPAFKHAVMEGKAKGVMCSYNEVNGIPSCANDFMNYTLRGKWCVPLAQHCTPCEGGLIRPSHGCRVWCTPRTRRTVLDLHHGRV